MYLKTMLRQEITMLTFDLFFDTNNKHVHN